QSPMALVRGANRTVTPRLVSIPTRRRRSLVWSLRSSWGSAADIPVGYLSSAGGGGDGVVQDAGKRHLLWGPHVRSVERARTLRDSAAAGGFVTSFVTWPVELRERCRGCGPPVVALGAEGVAVGVAGAAFGEASGELGDEVEVGDVGEVGPRWGFGGAVADAKVRLEPGDAGRAADLAAFDTGDGLGVDAGGGRELLTVETAALAFDSDGFASCGRHDHGV